MRKVYVPALLIIVTIAAATPLGAYVLTLARSSSGEILRYKWKSFPITWRMNPINGANLSGTRTPADVFTASFAAWQSIPTASISFTRGPNTDTTTQPGDDGINLVTTNVPASNFPAGVAALTRTVMLSGVIVEADIFVNANSNIPFTTNESATPGYVDLQSTMTHEMGHLLGMDHSPLLSATMLWNSTTGIIYGRVPSSDDMIGVSILYPSALFATKGKINGAVRTIANSSVYGAVVVAVNSNGAPVASTITDPNGNYTIEGLDAGSYTVYAEPLDGPTTIQQISTYDPDLPPLYPGAQVNTNFTTRSH